MSIAKNSTWQEHKVLIWGKTYPELSTKYYETVCTGGTLEDGRFIRLYPIPFRYLSDDKLFSKYQWLKVKIMKSRDDPRPESYKVNPESISVIDSVPSDKKGWRNRSLLIFKDDKYQFKSAEALFERNKITKISMGFVKPKSIDDIIIEERPKKELDDFLKKLAQNKEKSKQAQLFDFTVEEVKKLEFVSKRFKVYWHCDDPRCTGHKMSILDWEAYELARKVGVEKALEKLKAVLDVKKYDVGFFLGNFRLYQNAFAIGRSEEHTS